jgi:MFS family permease
VNILNQPHRLLLPPVLTGILRRVAVFQVCVTVGYEIIFVLGTLSAQKLTGTDRVFGVATITVFALGQLAIALPVGKWMDKYGRRPVLLLGSLLETGALVLMGIALFAGSSVWFCLGLLLLGLGSGAAQMAFLVGGDIYPPNRKAEGLGLMTGYISIGIVGGPYLVGLLYDVTSGIGWDPLIAPWFCISLLTALASWLMVGLRPEPLEVVRNQQQYYPNLKDSAAVEGAEPYLVRSAGALIMHYPIFASVGIMICFQGVRMSIVPLLTLILEAGGHPLSLSSLMVAAMGLGMVLSSSIIGRIGDKWGRKKSLLLAVAIGSICAIFIPRVSSLIGLFLLLVALGVAFSTALTMTRVMITDAANSRERGTAMALNSIAIGIAVVLFPTISSYVLSLRGWPAIAWVGILLMVVALTLLLFYRDAGMGKRDTPGDMKANER